MSDQGLNELTTDLDRPIGYSSRVLSQFAGARIDPYSINYSRLICKDVKISTVGGRTYNAALNNLPYYTSPDERLTFGFGESHILRNAGIHLYGYVHLTLASALGECFPEAYAGAVLSVMGRHWEDTVGISPHVWQMENMVGAFNGVMAPFEFGIVVDERVRLNPYTDSDQHCPRTNGLPPPAETAAAIQKLFDVSIGTRKNTVLVGGDVLGWMAAYAESELGLTVSIHDKDDNLLFSSKNGGQAAQVKIVYTPFKGTVEDSLSKTFQDSLRLDSPISSTESLARKPVLPFTGKVTWQSILPKVFGKSYYRLDHTESKMFGTFCGTTARVFQWLVENARDDIDPKVLSPSNRKNPKSYGPGLTETLTTWFPELRKFQGRMDRQLKLSNDEVGILHNELLERLETLCGCKVCERSHIEPPYPGPKDGFCLACLVETMITLALSLSRITVAPGIQPSRSGILHIYQSQVGKRIQAKKLPKRNYEDFKIVHGNEWNADYSLRLANCIAVFSGIPPDVDDVANWPSNLIAASNEGICAYVLGLTKDPNFKCGQESDNDVIRVVSGGICWKWKTFRRVCWGVPRDHDGKELDRLHWEQIKCSHLKQDLWCRQ